MGYFTRSTATSSTSTFTESVAFTSGATGVTSRDDTDPTRVVASFDGDVSCKHKMHVNEVEADLILETSDPRKKQNMVPMDDAMGDAVLQLTPLMYELKKRPGVTHAGYNAAQLQKLMPHAINESANGDLSVSYRMIDVHMLQLVQRMHAELQELKSQTATEKH
jgi:hypothetical protein